MPGRMISLPSRSARRNCWRASAPCCAGRRRRRKVARAAARWVDVEIDFQARKVLVRGEQLHLTPKEFDLLRYLVLNPNRAIPHRELLQAVWGPDYGDQVEYLRVFIKQLRRKIEAKPDKPVYLLTSHGSATVSRCPRTRPLAGLLPLHKLFTSSL